MIRCCGGIVSLLTLQCYCTVPVSPRNTQPEETDTMKISMHTMSVEAFVPTLTALGKILDKAAQHAAAKKFDPAVLDERIHVGRQAGVDEHGGIELLGRGVLGCQEVRS